MIVPFKARRPAAVASRSSVSSASQSAALSLTVEIRTFHSRIKQRRYFKSDEDYAEHRRVVDTCRANEGITQWTYPVAVSEWTGHDINKLVARVLEMMAALYDPEQTDHSHNPYYDPARAGAVKFRRVGRSHDPKTAYTRVSVTSRAKPYAADIDIPGAPIPARAFLEIFDTGEAGGTVSVELTGETAFGYFPATSDDQRRSRR